MCWSHELKNWVQQKRIYRLGTVQLWQFIKSKMIYAFWNLSFKYVFIAYLSITTDCCYCYWIQTDLHAFYYTALILKTDTDNILVRYINACCFWLKSLGSHCLHYTLYLFLLKTNSKNKHVPNYNHTYG